MKHELKRVDEERDSDGDTRWRWRCTYPHGIGHWNYQSDNVAREAWQQHELRTRPKPSGPASLRALISLGGDQ